MRNFRSAVLVKRYIDDLQRQGAAQEKRIQSLAAAGSNVRDAELQLLALRRALSALQIRSLGVAGGR